MSEIICYLSVGGVGVWCRDEVKKRKKTRENPWAWTTVW